MMFPIFYPFFIFRGHLSVHQRVANASLGSVRKPRSFRFTFRKLE